MSVLAELIAVLQTDRGFKNTALDFTTPLIHTHTCDFSQQHLALRARNAFLVSFPHTKNLDFFLYKIFTVIPEGPEH